jgi:hypothetical protein
MNAHSVRSCPHRDLRGPDAAARLCTCFPADTALIIDENIAEPLVLSAQGARDAHRELASNGSPAAQRTTAWSHWPPADTAQSWSPGTRG